MEPDLPMHPHSVLKDRLQDIDKQKEIELYYELLSSGHSVGEILNSLDHLQDKSEHGNVTITEYPSPKVDRVARDVTSEVASRDVVPADTECTPGLSAPA